MLGWRGTTKYFSPTSPRHISIEFASPNPHLSTPITQLPCHEDYSVRSTIVYALYNLLYANK